MTTKRETNLEKLQKAGIIDPKNLSQEHIDALNTLSDDEVAALFKLKSTLKASGPLTPTSRGDGTTDAV